MAFIPPIILPNTAFTFDDFYDKTNDIITEVNIHSSDLLSKANTADLASYQPLDSDLTAIAAISPANNDIIQRKGGAWVNRTPAQLKTDLAITTTLTGDVTGTGGASFATTIAAKAVTNEKLADATAWSLKGRNDTTSGSVSDITYDTLQSLNTPSDDNYLIGFSTTGQLRKLKIGDFPVAGGDMFKSVYDPNNVEADVFARENHTGTQEISTIEGLQTELNAKANTAMLGGAATLNVGTGAGTVAAGNDSRITGAVQTSRVISAGTGLTGGGNLSADRTISLHSTTQASLSLAGTALQPGDVGELAYKDQVSVSDLSATGTANSSTFLNGLNQWVEVSSGGGGDVLSVNGMSGAVILTPDDLDDTSTTHKFISSAELSKLSGIPSDADKTTATNVGTSIFGSTSKSTLADADLVAIIDTQASNVLKRITWANIKTLISAIFIPLASANTAPNADTIARRGSSGTLKASDPASMDDLTTKAYVDNRIANTQFHYDQDLSIVSRAIRVGPVDYPTDMPSGGPSSGYSVVDKSNSASDASILFRDQGAIRGEIGLVGDNNIHIKTVTGDMDEETFSDSIVIYNDGGDVEIKGNLGIGLKPWEKIHVYDNDSTRIIGKFENAGNGGSGFEFVGVGSDWYIGVDAGQNGNNDFFISDASSPWPPRFLMDGSGHLTLQGNIVVQASATVDGRDISVDGSKLDTISSGANVTNANTVAAAGAAMLANLADVATSGSYNDLDDKPSIPAGTVTSVGITPPTGLSVSGSPITSSGSFTITWSTGYQGYTTTEASKLSGIEEGADVTDAANVIAAGAAMLADEKQTQSGGANVIPKDLGNLSGQTIQLDCGMNPILRITNNGAGTLNASSTGYGVAMIELLNDTGAGAVTHTGFTLVENADVLTLASTDRFVGHLYITSNVKKLIWSRGNESPGPS